MEDNITVKGSFLRTEMAVSIEYRPSGMNGVYIMVDDCQNETVSITLEYDQVKKLVEFLQEAIK